jgi:hypothetical protein
LKPNILIITPAFTQLNTPYPATAYIKGFLKTIGYDCWQADIGIEVILKIFSKNGLNELFDLSAPKTKSTNAARIFALRDEYIKTIDDVILFLQGKNPTLALQICQDYYLPEASRFDQLEELNWAFGTMGTQDKAKHLATLYLEDISDFIVECIDANFGFSRYAERLGRSAHSFDEIYSALAAPLSFVDQKTIAVLEQKFTDHQPDLFLVSVPFPGNLFSAFRCAQWVKSNYPNCKIAMGGGFPNTELRSLSESRVFEFFDYITLDDGEMPLKILIENIENQNFDFFKRTFLIENNSVVYKNSSPEKDFKQNQVGTPDYSNLLLDQYISVIEIVNPMHRMWSDGRWNKLTMAHGCYWGKCTFCDISLDYIKLYEPVAAKLLCDRIEELIAQTGQSGFHFVDEAAPPALMRALAIEIIRRNLSISWWTNIRFEKSFTSDLCILLKNSGCIAVSGGLEVASERLLKLIDKGVTVAQVAQVTKSFTESGIMVHAYLMYGYPTQTIQETVDSLEMVRQMFKIGVLQSGFWHQFAMTAHSPVGLHPEKFGVLKNTDVIGTFANNDIDFTDTTGIDHNLFSYGLKKSLFNFMHGLCLDYPLQYWFDFKIPRTTIRPDYIEKSLDSELNFDIKSNAKVVWVGNQPEKRTFTKSKKGQVIECIEYIFYDKKFQFDVVFTQKEGVWFEKFLTEISIKNGGSPQPFTEVKQSYEKQFQDFEIFWHSKPINTLKEYSLLVL